MRNNPINLIPLRMLTYGGMLGGFTSLILIYGISAHHIDDHHTLASVFWCYLFQFGLGAIFGGFAGLFSGIAIIIVNHGITPHELRTDRQFVVLYRLYAGLSTAGMTILVFLPLFGLSFIVLLYGNVYIPIVICLSVGIAVSASQYTVTQYLRDIDVRKKKRG